MKKKSTEELCLKSMLDRERSLPQRRKGAKKPFRNAAALCAFAGEIVSEKILFGQSWIEE